MKGVAVLRWVAATGLAVGAAVYVVRRDAPPPAPVETSATARSPGDVTVTAEEYGALRREVALLGSELLAQRRALAARPTAATEEPGVPSGGSATPAESPEAQEQQRREYLAAIAVAFRAEVVEPRWSSAATSALRAGIDDDEQLRRAVRGVECRDHTCKVELTDAGDHALQDALPILALKVGQTLPRIDADRAADPSGGRTVTLYMSGESGNPSGAKP